MVYFWAASLFIFLFTVPTNVNKEPVEEPKIKNQAELKERRRYKLKDIRDHENIIKDYFINQ